MKRCVVIISLLFSAISASAQKLQTPAEFLGYELGDRFTPHHRVVDYFKYITSHAKNVILKEYGKSNEGRELVLAYAASDNNISRLDDIRANNLGLAGMEKASSITGAPVIVWLSYNVHGNEAASTEVSMQTLYSLADKSNAQSQSWLKNTVVIIDPCLNPDGRERYINFYNTNSGHTPDPLPYSREHLEPWPGGRSNHYYFDLNRDWAWQTQIETQQRMEVFNQWLPQIHVDFHEQGINEPYYFAPAAEPYHETITKWQRDFQRIIGENNAKYFDKNNWMYFTREHFDLLYPSYGDTYPIYSGSIGMTFEQGGSHRAGLAVITDAGDTLTLKDRIAHHYTTGMSTIEVASQYSNQLITEFKSFYEASQKYPIGEFKSYVIKADKLKNYTALETLLQRNRISYGKGIAGSARGYNYVTNVEERFQIQEDDLVISAYQPKSVLLKVLFEPKTLVVDSNTYDITAWAVPYAHGLQTYGLKSPLKPSVHKSMVDEPVNKKQAVAVAYIADWNSMASVKFLTELIKLNIRVSFSEVAIETEGIKFNPGSLIISKASNQFLGQNFDVLIKTFSEKAGIELKRISSGLVDKGADLGSGKIQGIKKPRIGVLSGKNISSNSLGEVWHFFDQEIGYPLSILRSDDFGQLGLTNFDILIFPDGSYPEVETEKLQKWVNHGGKLVAIGDAVAHLVDKKAFSLVDKEKEKEENDKNKNRYQSLKSYEHRQREYLQDKIPGAVYKVQFDNSHPLGFGFPSYYFTLKTNDHIYAFLKKGWNVGVLKDKNYVSGVVGSNVKAKLMDGLLFGVEEYGNGSVVYLADNPLFRGFWENGKLLFSNAVFMVGN